MTEIETLQRAGLDLAARFPALLVEAEKLAASFMHGAHGRRRAGRGDEFWQFRQAEPGAALRSIDWRRSATTDSHFVREKEWQAVQTVLIWADRASSMDYTSGHDLPAKGFRAHVLSLALGLILLRGGERVGLADGLPAATGHQQEDRIAAHLTGDVTEAEFALPGNSVAVLFSDFFTDLDGIEARIRDAASRGVWGLLVQVLDPAEIAFPFRGRTIFHDKDQTLVHETQKSESLQTAYQQKLSALQDHLQLLARDCGWMFNVHSSDHAAFDALSWIYHTLDGEG